MKTRRVHGGAITVGEVYGADKTDLDALLHVVCKRGDGRLVHFDNFHLDDVAVSKLAAVSCLHFELLALGRLKLFEGRDEPAGLFVFHLVLVPADELEMQLGLVLGVTVA